VPDTHNEVIDIAQESDITPAWREPVAAAVEWINETQAASYELTGFIEPTQLPAAGAALNAELGLILCDGEMCAREQVRVQGRLGAYTFSLAEAVAGDIPPLLDPPQGVRARWLDDVLAKYDFVLLLFYRGLW